MSSFVIEGGHKLSGEVTPQGAKNEALQILSSVLLTAGEVEIENIPDIVDVNKLIDLLGSMGVKTRKLSEGKFWFKADEINLEFLKSEEFSKKGSSLRGSVMILGPLLTRFGIGALPRPGGDKIGRRRMDTTFLGFKELGAEFSYDVATGFFTATVPGGKLKGKSILLDEASVTGTANLVMAAVMAEGVTTIYNAACEPYLQQLCKIINKMGGKISGVGSNLLTIEGVTELSGAKHRCLPDMIEVGSFIGMAAMTKSEITIKNVCYDELGVIPRIFKRMGVKLERRGDDIFIPAQASYEIDTFIDGSILTISDDPWPGFTPDLLSTILVL